MNPSPPALTPAARAAVPSFREQLFACGFTSQGLAAALGLNPLVLVPELSMMFKEARTPAWVSTDDTPLAVLIRFFILGWQLDRSRLEAIFSTEALPALTESGLIRAEGSSWSCNVLIVPWHGLLMCVDNPFVVTDREAVFIPDGSSAHLAQMVVPTGDEPRGVALDIGTGCGVSAIRAASHYRHVYAVDVNARAIEFTKFNALLNGVAVESAVCPPSVFDGQLPLKDLDLVGFVFPWLYPPPAIASQMYFGNEQLALDVYGKLPEILSASGRAVFFHQIRTDPPDHFESLLRRAECHRSLTITLDRRIDQPGGLALVRSLVRRKRGDEPFVTTQEGPRPMHPIAERSWTAG
jgi:hypothetical protein